MAPRQPPHAVASAVALARPPQLQRQQQPEVQQQAFHTFCGAQAAAPCSSQCGGPRQAGPPAAAAAAAARVLNGMEAARASQLP